MTALAVMRWLLYADLGVAFGVPVAACLTGAAAVLPRLRGWLIGAGLAGVAFSVSVYLLLVCEMAGTSLADIDASLAGALLTGSAVGWAFIARQTALLAGLALWVFAPRRAGWAALVAGIAVASLAWSGHAAAGDGLPGLIRLGSDVLHLLAASAWIGALVLFAILLFDAEPARSLVPLARFSGLGSALVAVLVATGLSNAAFLASPGQWRDLVATPYGQVLIIKLALFALMLSLAALNRLRLVPGRAVRPLRTSIAVELATGLAVLLCVGVLGTLDPLAA